MAGKYAMSSVTFDSIADCDIDAGRFKYVLIKKHRKSDDAVKWIVRGYNWAEWHADIYEKVCAELEKGGELECECVGGGRILHEPVHETIEVYGYSQGYGQADHEKSVEVIKKKYGKYEKILSETMGIRHKIINMR